MGVVVIGGGIVGLASAYYLAAGGTEVTVYEKGSIGSGSTERSAGGIRTQFSTPIHVSLSLASIAVWEDFEAEFGTDIAYRRPGYLFCARCAGTARAFEESIAVQHEQGVPSELLDPAEAKEYCPGLRAEKFRAAIHTNAPVTDVLCENGRVRGIEVNGKRIESDVVVNAAGPWARTVGEMAGLSLPIAPRRRQLLVAEPEIPVPEEIPLTVDLDTGSYFRPEREGAALVGGHFSTTDPDADPDRFSKGIDLDWSAEALERAADCTTYFGPEAGVKRGWTGLYAVTPDHHPVIEETIPGLITAAGFSGHGFQHAPATGRLVADLALDGGTTLLDIASLESDRFDRSGALVDERNVA